MYTEIKSYQIIIQLLKEYGISKLVLSAGSRNVPFVHSVEEDDFFECYSVVDERSAGYFALGLAQESGEPVVLSCTSSTATCNYWPPVAEAYYQNAPLVVMTSDRDPQMVRNREDQMIDQVGMYDRHVKTSVNLPIVRDEDDYLYCVRLVNEALLELDHRGRGPVHINIPMKYYSTTFPVKSLPEVKKIDRVCLGDAESVWAAKARELASAKRILVVCGQQPGDSPELDEALGAFCDAYGCVVAAEHMSNVHVGPSFNPSVCMDTRYVSDKVFDELMPDVVVSFGGNVMAGVKAMLCRNNGRFQHWLVQEDGAICDMFKSIKNVFECTPERFFRYMAEAADAPASDTSYREAVLAYANSVEYPELPWSNIYAIKALVDRIEPGSILHTSINSAIRVTNFYEMPEGVDYYANIGTHGIDGCLSSFLGQAAASPERPAYLVIGDLAFFYDMNALRIRHLGPNVKILLVNNHGGEEFYYNGMWQNDASDLHTTARHGNVAEGWVRSLGIDYFSARGKDEFDRAIEEFCAVEGRPALIEVFTEMRDDCKEVYDLYDASRPRDLVSEAKRKGKEVVKSTIGKETALKLAGKLGVRLK